MGNSRIEKITIELQSFGIAINVKSENGREVTIPKTMTKEEADKTMKSFREKASNTIKKGAELFKV